MASSSASAPCRRRERRVPMRRQAIGRLPIGGATATCHSRGVSENFVELINQTPLGARLWRSTLVAGGRMLGVVAIKGTYTIPAGALDVDAPHTLQSTDQETDLGVIPKDLV